MQILPLWLFLGYFGSWLSPGCTLMNWGVFTLRGSEPRGWYLRVSLHPLPMGLDLWPILLAGFSDLLQLCQAKPRNHRKPGVRGVLRTISSVCALPCEVQLGTKTLGAYSD